jgi:hypothetical protein
MGIDLCGTRIFIAKSPCEWGTKRSAQDGSLAATRRD